MYVVFGNNIIWRQNDYPGQNYIRICIITLLGQCVDTPNVTSTTEYMI